MLVSLSPLHGPLPDFHCRWSDPAFFCWAIFTVNYRILLMNLLPILPMDGGHILQSILWTAVGNFRSLLVATTAGIIGAVGVGILSMASQYWFIAAFMIFCLYESYRQRLILRENGPEDWRESFDYSQSLFDPPSEPKRRRLSRGAIRKARKIAHAEKAARDRIDAILAKVSCADCPLSPGTNGGRFAKRRSSTAGGNLNSRNSDRNIGPILALISPLEIRLEEMPKQ